MANTVTICDRQPGTINKQPYLQGVLTMLDLKKFAQNLTLSSFVFGLIAANANIAAAIQPTAKSSPIKLAQASPQQESVEANNFRFQLQNCQRNGQNVTCSFSITNLSSVDRSIYLYASSAQRSRIIDFFGREFFAQAVQVGSLQGTYQASATFVQGIPLRASVTFQLPQEVSQIALLEFWYYINNSSSTLYKIEYRNVNIVDPNAPTPEPTPVEPVEPVCNCPCPAEN